MVNKRDLIDQFGRLLTSEEVIELRSPDTKYSYDEALVCANNLMGQDSVLETLNQIHEIERRNFLLFTLLCQNRYVLFDFIGTMVSYNFSRDQILSDTAIDIHSVDVKVITKLQLLIQIMDNVAKGVLVRDIKPKLSQQKEWILEQFSEISEQDIYIEDLENMTTWVDFLPSIYDAAQRDILVISHDTNMLQSMTEGFEFVLPFHTSLLLG